MSTTQVRRNGAYAPLGANYADDDAIATLDLEENDRAELLWCRGLAYCSRTPRTEGYISDIALRTGKVLRRKPGKKNTDTIAEAAKTLSDLGLWTREGDGYRITAWLKWNKSWDEISRSRLNDRSRKAGSDTESEGNYNGSQMDSGRSPNGLQAPEQVSAVQGSTRQGSSKATGAAGAPDTTDGHQATAILEDHMRRTGVLLTASSQKVILEKIRDGLDRGTTQQVLEALAEYRRRPGSKPGLLPHLLDDVLASEAAQVLADDPTQTPEVQKWITDQQAKRAKAAAR